MSSNLPKKLFDYEAVPPVEIWQRITDALDENESGYATRLYDFQASPPAHVWAAIEGSIGDQRTEATVVPFFTRYRVPLRYIAAASIIAVMLVLATFSLQQSDVGKAVATNQDAESAPTKTPVPSQPLETGQSTMKFSTATSVERAKPRTTVSSLKRTLAYIRHQNIFPSLSITRRMIPRQVTAKSLLSFASPENFMVYTDGEGTAMKLPKKLFSLVNCPDGDGSCKERISQLQQKLASNANPTDFLGMVDLVRQLQ